MRIPEDELPPPHRPGTWCKIVGLQTNTDLNGSFVQLLDGGIARGWGTLNDGEVGILCDGKEYGIRETNLVPLPGSEKRAAFHEGWRSTTLMVNGINCEGCKRPLVSALEAVPGVRVVDAKTKAETGKHPNKVVVGGFLGADAAIKEAIAKLDNGRRKYTVK